MTTNDLPLPKLLNELVDTFNKVKKATEQETNIKKQEYSKVFYKELVDKCTKEAEKGKKTLNYTQKRNELLDNYTLGIIKEYFHKDGINMTYKNICTDGDCYAICYCGMSNITIEW